MPFDNLLFASHIMLAMKARTSSSVGDLIIVVSGVNDAQCERTYGKGARWDSCLLTELGEPIRGIAMRFVKLCCQRYRGHDS